LEDLVPQATPDAGQPVAFGGDAAAPTETVAPRPGAGRDEDAVDTATPDASIDGFPDVVPDAADDALWCGDVQAVPACVAYQNLLNSCFPMRNIAFACQSSILPTGDADVASIEELCVENFNRLMTACR
jgi:hypothetical protein